MPQPSGQEDLVKGWTLADVVKYVHVEVAKTAGRRSVWRWAVLAIVACPTTVALAVTHAPTLAYVVPIMVFVTGLYVGKT